VGPRAVLDAECQRQIGHTDITYYWEHFSVIGRNHRIWKTAVLIE